MLNGCLLLLGAMAHEAGSRATTSRSLTQHLLQPMRFRWIQLRTCSLLRSCSFEGCRPWKTTRLRGRSLSTPQTCALHRLHPPRPRQLLPQPPPPATLILIIRIITVIIITPPTIHSRAAKRTRNAALLAKHGRTHPSPSPHPRPILGGQPTAS